MSSLAVVLLNYARPQNMGRIVGSVREALRDAPIYILDQSGSGDFASRSDIPWGEVACLRVQANAGAGARVSLAAGLPFEHFLSIDDDTFLEPDQIRRLVALLQADPKRAHGVWGERLELSEGRIRFRSGMFCVDTSVSNLNQVYAFSRKQAAAAIELAARIGFSSWADVGIGNDILLSCASPHAPRCHDLGHLDICPTSDDPSIAIWRRESFRQRRAELAVKLVDANAIRVFMPLQGVPMHGVSEPIPGIWGPRETDGPGSAAAPSSPSFTIKPRGHAPSSRHVCWVVQAPVTAMPDESLYSPQASARYRCLIPAGELAGRGWQCSVQERFGRTDPMSLAADLKKAGVEIAVIGKLLGPRMLELARAIREQGITLIVDFCDDLFEHPRYGPLNQALAAQADFAVCSTELLAKKLERVTGQRASVISDPYEGPRQSAKFAPSRERLELLWFGHDANFQTIVQALPDLEALSRRYPLRLRILTDLDKISPPPVSAESGFVIEYVAWTLEGLWQRLAACDLVVLPTLNTPHHEAKSPNRLIEALWAGRAVIAHAIPSYREFSEFCWLGDDFAQAISSMIADPANVERRIAAGQATIAQHHAPSTIADQWMELLQRAAAVRANALTAN